MMTVRDVVLKTNFEDVFVEYKKHYQDEHRTTLMEIFGRLTSIDSLENFDNMVLFIRAIRENQLGEDEIVDSFDCDDKTVFFDVYGKDSEYEGIYSIASSSYEELLGYFISDETISKFSFPQIICHVLWALEW